MFIFTLKGSKVLYTYLSADEPDSSKDDSSEEGSKSTKGMQQSLNEALRL